MVIIYGIGVLNLEWLLYPACWPRPGFTRWPNARSLLSWMDDLFWSPFGKKMQRISGKTLFFLFWSSGTFGKKVEKNTKSAGVPRNANPTRKKIIRPAPSFQFWPASRQDAQRLQTNDFNSTKPTFH